MKSIIVLENLNLLELNIMLEHVRLGESHLKKYLSTKQLADLMALGSLENEQKQNIKSNKAEKSGNVALIFNTIVTSIFGAWIGFSGFMGLRLDSLLVLAGITGIAMFASGLVGYYSFRLTKTAASNAITAQKLHNLQLKLLKIIIRKRREDINKLIDYLNTSLIKLDDNKLLSAISANKAIYTFDTELSINNWLNDFYRIINNKIASIESQKIYQFYADRLSRVSIKLKKLLSGKNIIESDKVTKAMQLQPALNRKNKQKNVIAGEAIDFIKILTDATIAAPKVQVKNRSWLRNNFLSLFVGLAPTLLGGFASMFVFLSGGPNLAKDLGYKSIEALLKQPFAQKMELSIAVLLTLYFGFSNIYNNRKSFLRSHELDKTRKLIINQESTLVELNTRFNTLKKAKVHLLRIRNIYTALAKITPYWEATKEQINKYLKMIEALQRKQQLEAVVK